MSDPKRIQRKRAKGWKMPENAVYVGRPTLYGNPWRVSATGLDRVDTNEEAVALFTAALEGGFLQQDSGDFLTVDVVRRDLAGRDLACFCRLNELCHADVLLEIANPVSESVNTNGRRHYDKPARDARIDAAAKALESFGVAVPGYWRSVAETAISAADAADSGEMT